jgi:mannose-6-phosphate isomerase-like protein (cupin superfamily)
MMTAAVKKFNLDTEVFTPERCFIIELSNGEHDPAVSIARARVEPGVTTAWHKLRRTAERYIIVSGHGRAEIGNLKAADVGTGDVVCIPPDTPQRITNIGQDDLIFLAICSPRFTPGCYIALE